MQMLRCAQHDSALRDWKRVDDGGFKLEVQPSLLLEMLHLDFESTDRRLAPLADLRLSRRWARVNLPRNPPAVPRKSVEIGCFLGKAGQGRLSTGVAAATSAQRLSVLSSIVYGWGGEMRVMEKMKTMKPFP